MMHHISASILACDLVGIKDAIRALEHAGVSSIHYDVMDGHYVEAISFGDKLCREILQLTDLPVYVHLMVSNPLKQVANFLDIGVRGIAFHPVCDVHDSQAAVNLISDAGIQAGLAVSNDDEMSIMSHISNIDHVIAMTVTPGKCGQQLSPIMLEKVKDIKEIHGLGTRVFVDGGVSDRTFQQCLAAGADAFVMGSYLFKSNVSENVDAINRIGVEHC